MESLQKTLCKNCGDQLDASKAVNGVLKCPSCRSVFTVAKKETNPAALSSLRIAENELDSCSFDRAFTSYKKASQLDGKEPEAYFGMALSEFKVQFLKDVPNNRLQPICHEISDKKFTDSVNYKKALSLATDDQRFEYERNGQEIDYIREEFFKIKKSGLEYDSFICVKVTDDVTRQRTSDYKDADDIYFHLRRKGFKPFFSERELRNVTGADYEARILYALYTAECMLVVCNDESYLQTPWVKNEYTRFLKLIGDEEKESDSITIAFNGKPIERLPGKNGRIQGIDLANREAFTAIAEFVEKHTPAARKRREEEKRKKQEEADALKRQIEAQIEEQKRAQRELEKRLNSLNSAPVQGGGATATVNSLLIRARQELSFKDFDKAKDYFNKVLDADPQNADGWWGLFLVEFDVTDEKEIYDRLDNELVNRIYDSRNYKSAEKYATEETQKRIEEFNAGLRDPRKWWKLFLADFNTSDSDYIVDNISKEVKSSIRQNVNYKNATEYADEEFKPVLENFKNEINSPRSYWKLFLQEFSVNHENELLDAITEDLREQIEKSVNYNTVLRKAEGDLKERVEKFRAAMYSGEVWWKRFLGDYGAKSGPELIMRADNKQLFDITENPYYKLAYSYASGDFATVINSFIGEVFSFKLWWNRFLEGLEVKSEDELLTDFKYEYRNIPDENPCYRRAKKYSDDEEKKRIAKFEEGLAEHVKYYEDAKSAWDKMKAEFGCKSDADLTGLYKSIKNSKNYAEAVATAEKSCAKGLYNNYVCFSKAQEKAVEENCIARTGKRIFRTKNAFTVILIILCIAMALSGILSFFRVPGVDMFWVRPAMSFIGAHEWRALIIAIPAFFLIVICIVSNKTKTKKGNIASIALSVFVAVIFAFSVLAGYVVKTSTENSQSNLFETSTYVFTMAEEEETDSYIVKSLYLKDKNEKYVTVPNTFNGKPVTAIGEKLFYERNEIERIYLPKNLTSIGDVAFNGCRYLKKINIPANVTRIGLNAFQFCGNSLYGSEDTVIEFENKIGWYYAYKPDGSGGTVEEISPSDLSTSNARKFISKLTGYYMYRI